LLLFTREYWDNRIEGNHTDKAYSTRAKSEFEGKGSLAGPRRGYKDIRMDLKGTWSVAQDRVQ
jgi:hypothetical protein